MQDKLVQVALVILGQEGGRRNKRANVDRCEGTVQKRNREEVATGTVGGGVWVAVRVAEEGAEREERKSRDLLFTIRTGENTRHREIEG
jgi:microcompartment protein CcmK/EutM